MLLEDTVSLKLKQEGGVAQGSVQNVSTVGVHFMEVNKSTTEK